MTEPQTFSQALEAVHAMASETRVDANDVAFGDAGLAAQGERERDALGMFEDLVVNHSEEIDDRFPLDGSEKGVDVPEGERDLSRPSGYLAAVLEMAASHPSAGTDGRRALALGTCFLDRHGAALDAGMKTIPIP